MNYPSIKTIEARLNLDTVTAKKVRALIDDSTDPDDYQSVQEWTRLCYHEPQRHEKIMCALNELLEGFGIEYLDYRRPATYINMGDTYTATIIRTCGEGRYIVTSWGDYVESCGG